MNNLLIKIKCFFGWHCWTWKFKKGSTMMIDEVPYYATCKYCKKSYHKYYVED